ncbi:hypothetical protein D9M71_416530 [compost metagenome]
MAFAYFTARLQAEARRRQPGHFVHGGVQREQSHVAAEMSEHPRECAPQAWVRKRIFRQAVGADHRQRMREDPTDIRLIHSVVHRTGRLQLASGLQQRQIPFGGDVHQVAAAHLRMRGRPGDGDAVGIGHLLEVQGRRARGVGITVATHRVGLRCLFEGRQQLRTTPPVTGAGTFEVRDDHRALRMATDPVRLVHGLQHRFEFAAQMGGIDRPERGQFFGQLHHFIGRCREGAGIGKAGGQAQRTGLKAFAQLLAHRGDFFGCGGAQQIVEVVAAQCGMTHQSGDVKRGIRRFDRRPIVAEGRINERSGRAEQVHRIRRITAQTHR